MVDEITIRQAAVADIPDLVRLRRMMFEWMGCDDPMQLDAVDAACAAYFAKAIPAGEFYGWLAVTPTGEAVCSGGAVFDRRPPGPINLSGCVGYIMNISTDPQYRRQGFARRMMQTIIEWMVGQDV